MNKRVKWLDYERAVIVAHHRKFGMTNREDLYDKIKRHSPSSVNLEIGRFNNFILKDCMELHYKSNPGKKVSKRPGVRKKYIQIIKDLSI